LAIFPWLYKTNHLSHSYNPAAANGVHTQLAGMSRRFRNIPIRSLRRLQKKRRQKRTLCIRTSCRKRSQAVFAFTSIHFHLLALLAHIKRLTFANLHFLPITFCFYDVTRNYCSRWCVFQALIHAAYCSCTLFCVFLVIYCASF